MTVSKNQHGEEQGQAWETICSLSQSKDKADFLFRKAHKQLMYDALAEKSYAWSCMVQLPVRGIMSGVKRDEANEKLAAQNKMKCT